MRIAAAAAALLCVAPLARALCSGKACCSDCSTGQSYSGCTCLEDNAPVRGVVASAGEYRRFHYRITNWTLVAPEERKIGFRLTPCYGKVHLLIDTVINGFPTNESARWRGDRFGEENMVAVDLDYEQYFVSVFAVSDTNFTIEAIVDGSHGADPTEGANVTVTPSPQEELILDGDTMEMVVSFRPASDVNARYRVYSMLRDRADTGHPCATGSSDSVECVITTPCGVETRMQPASDWFSVLPSEAIGAGERSHTVSGLDQNKRYSFAVVMESSTGRRAVLTPTEGTPEASRVASAQSTSTMMYVGIGVGALFLVLVLAIFVARSRLRRAYQVRKSK